VATQVGGSVTYRVSDAGDSVPGATVKEVDFGST
jgi:hypothetical protein